MNETVANPDLKRTPVHDAHVAAGARMVGFAGYRMPVQYSMGVLKEHLHCRAEAGLFDVSHMGQAELTGPDLETAARALEALVPADIVNLAPGRQRYTQLLTSDGGILDDLMVSVPPRAGRLNLVVNAAGKLADYAHIASRLPGSVALNPRDDLALIAIQGPAAEAVVAGFAAGTAAMAFMDVAEIDFDGIAVTATRSGYTGEDGFELSLAAGDAPALWARFAGDERVEPIGLGARDSLRLEAGLCLYGADIDTTTTPVEAGLVWSIHKRRRQEGGFPGAAAIRRQIEHGPLKRRVGLLPDGPAPVRPGTPLFADETATAAAGYVTSGTMGPSLGRPVAMGYVAAPYAAGGTPLFAEIRGRRLPVSVAPMPFVPARFKRKSQERPR